MKVLTSLRRSIGIIVSVGLVIAIILVVRKRDFCGSTPEKHPLANTPWEIITEDYSCGVISQWAEVVGFNKLTGERVKILSFRFVEEFHVSQNERKIILTASDATSVTRHNAMLGPFEVRYRFGSGELQ